MSIEKFLKSERLYTITLISIIGENRGSSVYIKLDLSTTPSNALLIKICSKTYMDSL